MASPSPLSVLSSKELHALVLLVQEILFQLDEVASLRRRHGSAHISMAVLREMCGVLKEVEPRLLEACLYLLVVSSTSKAKPSQPVFDDEYVQHSVPTKQRLLSHIREELLSQAA